MMAANILFFVIGSLFGMAAAAICAAGRDE